MFDTLILGGTIVDGTGYARYKADIGITNGKITAIGSLTAWVKAEATPVFT